MDASSTADIDYQLISARQLRAVLGNCSEMHVWRLMRDANYADRGFPKAIKMGNRNFFRLREVRDWIDAQAGVATTSRAAT